jgi:hypothetical protein
MPVAGSEQAPRFPRKREYHFTYVGGDGAADRVYTEGAECQENEL